MSDDLISRKALFKDFEKTITGKSDTYDWLRMISRQPVAYDVDKVTESIQSEIRCVMDTYCGSFPDDAFLDLETLEQEIIEKIVKAGGKE